VLADVAAQLLALFGCKRPRRAWCQRGILGSRLDRAAPLQLAQRRWTVRLRPLHARRRLATQRLCRRRQARRQDRKESSHECDKACHSLIRFGGRVSRAAQ